MIPLLTQLILWHGTEIRRHQVSASMHKKRCHLSVMIEQNLLLMESSSWTWCE